MFLQKLHLKPDHSYSTTTTLENIVENLHLSFNHIVILTPFISKSDSVEQIRKNISNEKSTSLLTPSVFIENIHLFDCSHIILQDRELFDKFEIDLSIIPKPFIEIGNTANYPLLNLCKMNIKVQNEDVFVVLFILSKLFTGKVVAKKTEKIKIFFKVFHIEWEVLSYEELKSDAQLECIIFLDGYKENNSERIFCIGNNTSGFYELKIDLSLAGKFKPRIGEVFRAITPAILKGQREFDYTRFLNIYK